MRRFWLAVILTLAAYPAQAIDCTKAKNNVERAICGDQQALAADKALGLAYSHLLGVLSDDERADLRLSQNEWIQERDSTCFAKRADTPLPKCLAKEATNRQTLLEGKPGLFRPVLIYRPATSKTAKLSINAIKFTGTGVWQTKANAWIEDLVKGAIDDAKPDRPPLPSESFYVELNIGVYASPRLVSVSSGYNNYVGQAHEFRLSRNLNIEIPTGQELKFDDYFKGAKASELFQECRSQVLKQRIDGADIHGLTEDEASNVDLQEVINRTSDFSGWSFGSDGVSIDYGDYAFGGYGRCMCSCDIPYSRLRPLISDGLSLP